MKKIDWEGKGPRHPGKGLGIGPNLGDVESVKLELGCLGVDGWQIKERLKPMVPFSLFPKLACV